MAKAERHGPHRAHGIDILHKLVQLGARFLVGAPNDWHEPWQNIAMLGSAAELNNLLLHAVVEFAGLILVELDCEYDFTIARGKLLPAGRSTGLHDDRAPLRGSRHIERALY